MDEEGKRLHQDMKDGKVKELSCNEEGVLKFRNLLFVPNVEGK